VDDRQRAIKRWLVFALVWQGLVLAGVLVYVLVMTRTRRADLSWVAPPLGALLGTALPYQLAVVRLTRAAWRE
jgi:hypothetical protein